MGLSTKSKATAASVLRSNKAVETHYARHKACESIKDQLDALDPQNFIDEETTAMMAEKKKDHEEEAAKLRQLAIEQDNKSKAVQKEIDTMKEDGKKECNKAREILLKQQTAAEASLLRAKSRLNETLNRSLKETEYGGYPASDSDEEVEPGTSSQGCDQDSIDASADSDDNLPVPKWIKAPIKSMWGGRPHGFKGNPPRKPARRSTKTDAIDVEDEWVVQ
jgi:hypothetical protein